MPAMLIRVLIWAVIALAIGEAAAEKPYVSSVLQPVPPVEPRHESLFGLRMSIGTLPIDGARLVTAGPGLTYERRVRGAWRVVGELEYVWLGIRDDERMRQDVVDGGGERLQLAIRRTLLSSWPSRFEQTLRFYVDGELGGGLLMATEPHAGRIFEPNGFVGVRAGYDFVFNQRRRGASRFWEPEVLLRVLYMGGGAGMLFGVGMGWGD